MATCLALDGRGGRRDLTLQGNSEGRAVGITLVESEKTAVICAGLMPRYVWVATGGKSQLNAERLSVLAGRKVVAFPDVDAFEVWSEKLAVSGLDVVVSPLLQQEATPEDFANHIDIADWLIRTRHARPDRASTSHSRAFLLASRFLDPENAEAVEGLIEDLGLEFMGAEPFEPPCHSERSEESPE